MALTDLMKKGFLTSATLTVATLATLAPKYGGTVATVATVAVANSRNYKSTAPTVATVATVAVANLPNLKTAPSTETMALPDLVRGFMDEDGVTLAEAQALAAISVQPRPAAEWLAMIAELDALIGIYCANEVWMTDEAKAAIWATRCAQSLASIPDTLAWFRREVARMTRATPAPARYRDLSGSIGARSEKFTMNWPEPITKESTQ
jgi:hypothetical protein